MATGPAAGTIAPGQLLASRYEVRSVLGVGGEGVVVEAVDTRHDRRVAVKVRELGDRELGESLLAEARALLSLAPHPALPTVREDVLVEGRYLLVMDWVDGVDLQQALADGPLRPGRAMVLLSQVAAALDHLHAHGLAHGDVKPANILELPGGRAQLVDLGMAAASVSHGSPGFAAPERDSQPIATPAGDVFAFAATAVALLAGEPPLPTPTGGQAVELPPALPEAFRAPLSSGLARDIAARPPSAGALLRAMQQAVPTSVDDIPPTFLMTDIVGSTRKWEDQPTAMSAAMEAHDRRIEAVVSGHGGQVLHLKGEGDSTVSRFASVADALEAAAEMQAALTEWDEGIALRLTVRASVHCGAVDERDGRVFGPTLNQGARLRSAGHGGQVLVSEAAVRLLGDELPEGLALVSLGQHRIRDLNRLEPVYQLAGRSLQHSFQPLKTLDRLTNLPHLDDELIGRDRELAAVADLLPTSRTVTLVGAGGSGKTRLALQVGADSLGQFGGGVWFVALSGVSDPAGVGRAMLEAAGISGSGTDPVALMTEALRGDASLLILDNCEHLLEEVASLAHALTASAPGVTILATSRERLRIDGEVIYPVPLLAVPAETEDAEASPAVQLFVRRAAQARPGFAIEGPGGAETLAAIAELCRRVDGIPLAIELAASRVSAIPPEKLAGSIADRFRLASGGNRSALPRHQSLHATIEWSESLLPEPARVVWRRASVFRDGFSLDGATAVVCGLASASDGLSPMDDLDLIEALTMLVDASIVSVDPDGRYRLLETLREFGAERLLEAGEEAAAMVRLIQWLDATSNGGFDGLVDTVSTNDALQALAAEHTNLISAMAWGLEHEPRLGAELTVHAWLHFYTTSRWSEARPFLDKALPVIDQLSERDQAALVLCAAHVFAYGGDVERALPLLSDGFERAKAVGDPVLEWISLVIMGAGSRAADGDRETYRACFAQAIEIADRLQVGFLQAASRLWASWEMFGDECEEHAQWAARWAAENKQDFIRRQVEESHSWFSPEHSERLRRLELRYAEDLATNSHGIWTESALAEEYLSEGRYEEAAGLLRSAIRRNSGSHAGAMRKCWLVLCMCEQRMGHPEQAEEAWEQAMRWESGPLWDGYVASAALATGRLEAARKALVSSVAEFQDASSRAGPLEWWDLFLDWLLVVSAAYFLAAGSSPALAAELIANPYSDPNNFDLDSVQRTAAALRAAGVTIPAVPSRRREELLELVAAELALSAKA